MKGMLFGCEQPFLWGERCVTSQRTAAEETTTGLVRKQTSGIENVNLKAAKSFWVRAGCHGLLG